MKALHLFLLSFVVLLNVYLIGNAHSSPIEVTGKAIVKKNFLGSSDDCLERAKQSANEDAFNKALDYLSVKNGKDISIESLKPTRIGRYIISSNILDKDVTFSSCVVRQKVQFDKSKLESLIMFGLGNKNLAASNIEVGALVRFTVNNEPIIGSKELRTQEAISNLQYNLQNHGISLISVAGLNAGQVLRPTLPQSYCADLFQVK